jgi:TRAP-type C4-dicarboxylate transport system substrate-binding protein
MIKKLKDIIPLSILASGIMITTSIADTFTLRVGSGHPSKPTAYVTNMEKVLVPNIKRRVAAETEHKVRIIEAYAGKIAKVHETLEAVEKGLLDIGSYCVCFEASKLLPWNFDYFVPFTAQNLETTWAVKHKIIKKFPKLTQMLEDKFNQKFLGLSGWDDYGISNKKYWDKANELIGVKIVAAGPNLPWVSLFGAVPVTSTLPTIYNDLATGVADGNIIFPSAQAGGFKFYEVAPYWKVMGFGAMAVNITTINLDTLKKLPPEVAKIIIEEAQVYEKAAVKDGQQRYQKGLDDLVKLGKERGIDNAVTYLPIDQQKIWAEKIKDWPNTRAQDITKGYGIDGAALMNAYMDEIEKTGHKFPVRYKIGG